MATWLATLGGLGRLPGPAGTYGTALGVAGYVLFHTLPHGALLLVAVALNVAGIPLCHAAARQLDDHDPSTVIWDEFASVFLLFCLLPAEVAQEPVVWGMGFLLHRLFDITKFPPVSHCEKLPGGWGIMGDDVAATLYAWLVIMAGRTVSLAQ